MLARKVVLGLAVVLVLAVATPAMAADSFKGWYGGLDLALTQPVGLDQHYANEFFFRDLDPNFYEHSQEVDVKRLVLDNEAAFTWSAAFGYSWGKMGSLQVSYWKFDHNDSVSDTTNNNIYATVAGYTYDVGGVYLYGSYSGNPPVHYKAKSELQASLWDIDYIRPMSVGDKFTMNWVAGLRSAEYKENRRFLGQDFRLDPNGVVVVDNQYEQQHRQKGNAWGFKVGAIANMDFTKQFGMVADLSVSFLQAQTDGTLMNCRLTCDQFQAMARDVFKGNNDNQRGEIRDYGLKAVWHQGPVDIFVGFKSSNWDGIVSDPVPPVGGTWIGIGQAGTDGRNSIAFNSWNVGATWKIGG